MQNHHTPIVGTFVPMKRVMLLALASLVIGTFPVALSGQTTQSIAQPTTPQESPQPGTPNAGPVASLEQFGPIATVEQAEATYQAAMTSLTNAGGGVLVIPANTPPLWKPKNNTQLVWRTPAPPAPAERWGYGKGVTVVDLRDGALRILPPQTSGVSFDRVMKMPRGMSLPFWDIFPILRLNNTVLNGSCSYRDYLQEDVKAGNDRRFYVATIRGIFPGAFVAVSGSPHGVLRLYVKSLGYDKEKSLWYFIADTTSDVKKGEVMGNKNNVSVVDMETKSHNENQTTDLLIERRNYSQGDNYLIYARMKYMSDIHSTGGDESGVIYGAFINSDTDVFRGQVEKWDAQSQELKYKPGTRGDTLGTGRPLINANPKKWVTAGTVVIVRPFTWNDPQPGDVNPVYQGSSYPTTIEPDRAGVRAVRMGGLMRFSKDAPISQTNVGWYFAVDEKDEYIPDRNKIIRRWYLIDSIKINDDGTKDLRIVRHWWGKKTAGSPTLYKQENYTCDGHEKPLHYIIAPGGNVYDVSDGVNNPLRTIRVVPGSFTETPVDFAPGDDIEQAMGPDPFMPVPFRAWTWDQVPGIARTATFDIANNGVMRDSVLTVHGGSTGDIDRDLATRYDRNPTWNRIMRIEATSNTGIDFEADNADAAIFFRQMHKPQLMKWNFGRGDGRTPSAASFGVSPDNGDFNFTGGSLRTNGCVVTNGLSADATPARNLRGKNVVIEHGATSITITFAVPESDENYAVFVDQNWLTGRAVTTKLPTGFTVEFEKPAPAGAKFDWMIVR